MRLRFVVPFAVVPALAGVAGVASAQGRCEVSDTTNEAKLQAFYAAPLAFSPSGLLGLRPGSIQIGADFTLVPEPSNDISHPTLCYVGKEENTRLSPIFPRPHLRVGLPAGFFVEAMYLPPITVADATPNLGSVALGVARPITPRIGYALRAHATVGQVKGPITCNDDALQTTDPSAPCYGNEQSEDTYKPNLVGAEAGLTWQWLARVSGYVGAGVSTFKPRFQVGFTDLNGNLDDTLVLPERMTRLTLLVGSAWAATPRISLTGELYSAPEDMTTIRLGGVWTIR
jgi:hypothetical protein